MLFSGTRCPASAAASSSCRSARSKPCMRTLSQGIEHRAGKHAITWEPFQQAPSRTSLGRAPASQQGLETRQGSAEAEPVNDQLDLGKELQSGKSVPAWGGR